MAKIVFNIAYFSPIVISCWRDQEETKRETTEINMGEKQEKRGGRGARRRVIWRRKGGIFIVIPVLVLSLFVIIVLSRSLLPPPALCRVVSQIMQPSPFFLRVRSKNIRFSVVDRSSQGVHRTTVTITVCREINGMDLKIIRG